MRLAEKVALLCDEVMLPALDGRAGGVSSLEPDQADEVVERFFRLLTEEGRDPADITVSTIVRFDGDLDAMVREAEGYGRAGIDLGIVSIPKSADPAIVEPIADALAGLD